MATYKAIEGEVDYANIRLYEDEVLVRVHLCDCFRSFPHTWDLDLYLDTAHIPALMRIAKVDCWEDLEGCVLNVDVELHGAEPPTFARLSRRMIEPNPGLSSIDVHHAELDW